MEEAAVYILQNKNRILDKYYYEMLEILPVQRKKYIERYSFMNDKMNGLLAYILLQYAIYQRTGDVQQYDFIYDENQKPYIASIDLSFNLSHCKSAVACAIDKYDIGVDVEDYQAQDASTAFFVLSPKEWKNYELSVEKERLFTYYWTLKESLLKMQGTGILDDMKKLDFEDYWENGMWNGWNIITRRYDTFSLAVCSRNTSEIIEVSLDTLLNFITSLHKRIHFQHRYGIEKPKGE